MQNHQKFYSDLSIDEKRIFNLYKSNAPLPNGQAFSDYINSILGPGALLSEEDNLYVVRLDEIIQMNTLETEMWLYRATDTKFISKHIKDDLLTYPSFMSTATEIDKLQRHYANVDTTPAVLRIKCPDGTFAAPMEGNQDFGYPEYEYLLGRNGVFRVIDCEEITEMVKIEEIMGKFYANGFSKLIDYTLEFLFYGKDEK